MSETIRAFVAIELGSEVRDALADLVRTLGRAGVRGLRPVRPEAIHLTLKFLGDVGEQQVGPIAAALSEVAWGHEAFTLEVGDVGVFPNRRSARVLWVGIAGDLGGLRSLQGRVDESLAALAFARDRRQFSPHLTVARLRDGTPAAARRVAAETLFAAGFHPEHHFRVEAISLMRSTLHPTGAVYERLARAPLKDGAPGGIGGRETAC